MTLVRKPVYSDSYQEIGQVITTASAISSLSLTNTDQFVPNAVLILPPGKWQIYYSLIVDITTTTAVGNTPFITVALSDSVGNRISKTGRIVQIKSTTTATVVTASSIFDGHLSATYITTITADTTFRIVAKHQLTPASASITSSSAGLYDHDFYAVRIGHS
jgi:hypothetical protein